MNKKGLSDVVTTVLIILISMSSIVIIWVVAKAFLFESASQIETGLITTTFSVQADSVQASDEIKLLYFNAKKESGDSEVTGLNVILEDESGTSKSFLQDYKNNKFNLLETRKIEISYLDSGLGKIKRISLAPIILNRDGKELTARPSLAYVFKGNEKKAGMVLYLDFENGFQDKSGYGYSVSNNGVQAIDDPSSTNKRVNTKVGVFVQSELDYLSIPDSDSLDLGTGSFTIAFWARPEGIGVNNGGSVAGQVIDKKETNFVKGYEVRFRDPVSAGGLEISPWIISGSTTAPTYISNKNSWNYYVIVVDRNAQIINLYTPSGENMVKQNPLDTSTGGVLNLDNTGSLLIGKSSFSNPNFNGKLDDIMIFNRALNDKELKELYKVTKK